ncbi:MAG: PHP domain-containing protein [Candidatus Moranbacteria bacterium]|nr:PHP domain-containing protein [Candidatus Moranbacteria bacterium]
MKCHYGTTVVDLHIHSNYSDGTRSPKKIVALAQKAGLKAIALTDHDTVAGVDEFLKYAAKTKLTVSPAIEVTSFQMGVEVHILGYGINHAHRNIGNLFLKNIEARRERLNRTLELLDKHGIIQATEAEIADWFNYDGPVISIYHLIEYVSRMLRRNFLEVKKLFKRGGVAWVSYDYSKLLSADEAVRIITRELGGVAVLAHPGKILKAASYGEEYFHQNSWHILHVLLSDLKREGLGGIESFHPAHDQAQQENLVAISKKLGLHNTAGSDFHGGKFKKNKKLGMPGIGTADFLSLIS